jgi:predicted phosphoribosyltransferase
MNAGGRFESLRSGGRQLALQLADYRGRDDVVVLGIVLGGVPVAHEVASSLGAPLDLIIIRRLLAPPRPELPICAVNVAGTEVIDKDSPPRAASPSTGLEYFIEDALSGLTARTTLCRGARTAIDLKDKTVVIVDCGINTGSTMQASIAALRTLDPKKIIAAVPVASFDGRTAVTAIADELVCLAEPQPFGHVGLWYADFSRPGDEGVAELL